MESKGKVISVLELQTGKGANGDWKNQDFVIETDGQYPKKQCYNLWGDKISMLPQVGDNVNVSFDAESREYNGRWYTTLKAYKVTIVGAYEVPPSAPLTTQEPTAPLPF